MGMPARRALPGSSGRTLCRWGSAWWPCGTSSPACPACCYGAVSISPAGEENLNKPTGPPRPSSRCGVSPALTSSVDRLWILPECRITRSKRSATLRKRQLASPGGHMAGRAAARTSSHSSASAAPGPAGSGASGGTDPQFCPLYPVPPRPVPSHPVLSRPVPSVPSRPTCPLCRPAQGHGTTEPPAPAERSGPAAPIYAVGCARRGGRSLAGPSLTCAARGRRAALLPDRTELESYNWKNCRFSLSQKSTCCSCLFPGLIPR